MYSVYDSKFFGGKKSKSLVLGSREKEVLVIHLKRFLWKSKIENYKNMVTTHFPILSELNHNPKNHRTNV